jgi:formylmethanofuran dehydrogenase subunit E
MNLTSKQNTTMEDEYVYDRDCKDCGAKTCAEKAFFYNDETFCEDCCPEGYGE